ncbi:MAG: hypothetical protein J6W70_06550, partial [Lentisphaeria bacterium]|nr:hypothetical protein [Lentisphaeria bacterium]
MSQIISRGESSGTIYLEYDSLIVESGGRVGEVFVGEGGILVISEGGKVSSASVSGLYCEVSVGSGADLSSATIGSGAWITVLSGGTVTAIVEDGGFIDDRNGAEVTFIPHEIPELVVGADQSATIHAETTVGSAYVTGERGFGGWLLVCESATLSHITVTSYGELDALGLVADVTVREGGYVNARTNTMRSVYVYDGGYAAVYSTGAAEDVTIYNGGSCNVNGGSASFTIVSSGGTYT